MANLHDFDTDRKAQARKKRKKKALDKEKLDTTGKSNRSLAVSRGMNIIGKGEKMKPPAKKETIYITNHAVERISQRFFHTKEQNTINFLFKWLKGFTNPIWLDPKRESYVLKLPEGVNLVVVYNEKYKNYVVLTALTRKEMNGKKVIPHGHLRIGHVLFARENRKK